MEALHVIEVHVCFMLTQEDWSSELSDQDPSDEETTDMETENLEQDK